MDKEIFMTIEDAEEIIMAVEVGAYAIDYPGNRSKLAHARLLLAIHIDGEEVGE